MSKFKVGDKVQLVDNENLEFVAGLSIGDTGVVVYVNGHDYVNVRFDSGLASLRMERLKLHVPPKKDNVNDFQVGDEVEVVSVDGIDIMRGLKKGKKLTVGKPINKNIVYFKKSDYGLFPEQLKLVEPKQTHKDNINPSHYTQGKYETIDIILDRVEILPGQQATLVGNIIKYLWRYDKKNGVEDLKKADWYLNKLIEVVDGEQIKKLDK